MRFVCLSPLSVGLVEWRAMEAAQTLVVKATFELGGGGKVIPSRFQAPLSLDAPHAEDPRALRSGSDFAPFKRDVDVLVVGRAYAQAPAPLIWCGVGIDGFYKRFAAISSEGRTSIPLTPARLRLDPYGPPVPHDVGPRPFASGPASAVSHPKGIVQTRLPADCPPAWFNVAPMDQRIPALSPTATLTFDGLLEGGGRWTFQLPGMEPRALALPALAGSEPRELALRADTFVVDGERKLIFLVFRCELPADFAIAQVVLTLAQRGTVVDWVRASSDAKQAKTGDAVDPFSLLGESRPFEDSGDDDDEQATGTVMQARVGGPALPFQPAAGGGDARRAAPGSAAGARGLPFAAAPAHAPGGRDSQPRGGLPFVPAPPRRDVPEPEEDPTPQPRANPMRGKTIVSHNAEPRRDALPFAQSLQRRLGGDRPAPIAKDDSGHTALLDIAALRAQRAESDPKSAPWDEDSTTQHELPPMPGRLGSEAVPVRLGAVTLSREDPLTREDLTEDLDKQTGASSPGYGGAPAGYAPSGNSPAPDHPPPGYPGYPAPGYPAPGPAGSGPAGSGPAGPAAAVYAPPGVPATLQMEAPWAGGSQGNPTPPAPAPAYGEVAAAQALPFPQLPQLSQPSFAHGGYGAPPLVSQVGEASYQAAPPLPGWGVTSAEPAQGFAALAYAPPPPASPMGIAPPPAAAYAPPTATPAPAPTPARTDAEELEAYVTVKASAWRPGNRLSDVLREAGLDELGWLDLEGRIQAKLTEEAKEGGSRFARALRRALRDANKSLDERKLKG